MSDQITMKDIARMLGVSVSTVGRSLADRPEISGMAIGAEYLSRAFPRDRPRAACLTSSPRPFSTWRGAASKAQ